MYGVRGETPQEPLKTTQIDHNIITKWREATGETGDLENALRRQADRTARERIWRALGKCKNQSAPGPDGISWRVLKIIKCTPLGRAVCEDIAVWASPGERVKFPSESREITMVMIPKPRRDHTKVKGC